MRGLLMREKGWVGMATFKGSLSGTLNHRAHGLSHEPAEIWQDSAACKDMDPEIFETALEGQSRTEEMNGEQILTLNLVNFKQAKKACDSCVVLFECSYNATPGDFLYTFRAGRVPQDFTGRKRGRPLKTARKVTHLNEAPPRDCIEGHGPMGARRDASRKTGWRYICQKCAEIRAAGGVSGVASKNDPTQPCPRCGSMDWLVRDDIQRLADDAKKAYVRSVCRPCNNRKQRERRASAKMSE